jgi:hypothetical protein
VFTSHEFSKLKWGEYGRMRYGPCNGKLQFRGLQPISYLIYSILSVALSRCRYCRTDGNNLICSQCFTGGKYCMADSKKTGILNDISCSVPSYLRIYIRALQEGGLLNAIRVVLLMRVRTQGIIPNILFFYRISRGSHIKYIKYQ